MQLVDDPGESSQVPHDRLLGSLEFLSAAQKVYATGHPKLMFRIEVFAYQV